MTINKAIVIVLAVVALGLFAIAGSVIYATQQLQEDKPLVGCKSQPKLRQDQCLPDPISKKESKKRLKDLREGR